MTKKSKSPFVTEACVLTGQVDWQQLRKQKHDLINVLSRLEKEDLTTEDEDKSLQGLLNFIDHIQDEAATTIGEEIVFCDFPGQEKEEQA